MSPITSSHCRSTNSRRSNRTSSIRRRTSSTTSSSPKHKEGNESHLLGVLALCSPRRLLAPWSPLVPEFRIVALIFGLFAEEESLENAAGEDLIIEEQTRDEMQCSAVR